LQENITKFLKMISRILKLVISIKFYLLVALVLVSLSVFIFAKPLTNTSKIQLGAYYFDGWTGTYPYHITATLKDSFPEREPKWGWITSKQKVMDEQIELASSVGLSFFSFCWYFKDQKSYTQEPLNNALGLYKKSVNKRKLKYCLLVTNHTGFEFSPDDWSFVTKEWIFHFKDKKSYLTVDGKPLIIFFSVKSLIKKFGNAENVRNAFDELKQKSIQAGLKGVTIACCISDNKSDIKLTEKCGFDVLTGYNYRSAGFSEKKNVIPIQNLIDAEPKIWNKIIQATKLKYIPLSTLNWDPRPWSDGKNWYSKEPHYTGFSVESVFKSVRSCIDWIRVNQNVTTKEKIAILNAWNENGEGAWLTPGKNGFNPAEGVRLALKGK
jgi:Glycosyltransferase WbsX